MAAEEAGWHEEAARLCGEEDLMAAVGDRSIFNLDDINLDDIFLDLNDADIPAFGAADNPPQGGLLSSGNLHGSAAAEDAPMSVDAAPAAGGAVLPEGLLCDDIDVTQLEWLSNFCEESYSSDSLGFIPCNAGDAAFHISCDDGENKKMRTNVAAAAGAAKEERNFRTSSPISVLEHTGLTVGISPPTSLSTSATTSSSTSSLSSPTSSSCSGIGGGDGDINKVPPEPVIIPARSRSKRPRPASFSPRPPIVLPLPPSSEAPAPSAASAAAPLGSVEHDNFELVAQANQLENAESACPNKSKKKKKAPPPATTDGEEAAVTSCPAAAGAVRRCMHCEVTKTPQWRAGPMGPKTLCNACGVRYKSGRLFPEYRPAASPTFMASQHSNSHKKVVEMRINSIHDTTETAKPGARRHDVASKACELLEYIRRGEWCGDTTGIIMSE